MIAFSQSTVIYHLDRLRSTRRAKKVAKNKVTKAMETTLGFCKCADSGTLYVTYAKPVSGVQITVRATTHIDQSAVLIGQILE